MIIVGHFKLIFLKSVAASMVCLKNVTDSMVHTLALFLYCQSQCAINEKYRNITFIVYVSEENYY